VSTCGIDHCITCADDGVPMTVLRVDDAFALALCEDPEGTHHTVEITLLDRARPGDRVLVHAGVALVAL
jgi:hydrogenase maturation factor